MYQEGKRAVIHLRSGGLRPDGTLDERTENLIEKALAVAARFRDERKPYAYMVTAGSYDRKGQRPCDVMRIHLLQHDPSCRSVIVPDSDVDITVPEDSDQFFRERTRGWCGDATHLN
jgi:hypothetical protein